MRFLLILRIFAFQLVAPMAPMGLVLKHECRVATGHGFPLGIFIGFEMSVGKSLLLASGCGFGCP